MYIIWDFTHRVDIVNSQDFFLTLLSVLMLQLHLLLPNIHIFCMCVLKRRN